MSSAKVDLAMHFKPVKTTLSLVVAAVVLLATRWSWWYETYFTALPPGEIGQRVTIAADWYAPLGECGTRQGTASDIAMPTLGSSQYVVALHHLSLGEHQVALQALERAGIWRSHRLARHARGVSLWRAGEQGAALAEWRQAGSAELFAALRTRCLAAGEAERARGYLDLAAASVAPGAAVALDLATDLMLSEQYTKAGAVLDVYRAGTEKPEALYYALYGWFLARQTRDMDKTKDARKIADALQQAVTLAPGDGSVTWYACLGAWATYEAGLIRRICAVAAQVNPQNEAAPIVVGTTYLDAGDLETAYRWYERAAFHPSGLTMMGRVRAAQGRHQEAVDLFQRSLERRQRGYEYFLVARSQMALGRWQEAREALRQATALEPSSTDYHVALGDVCRQLGDRDCARQAYQQALALDPTNGPARQAVSALEANPP